VSTNRSPVEERLLNQSHPPGSPLAIAALHLRSAANQRPPGPMALARVRARLSASRAWSGPKRLRWKTALAVVAISAGIGGATGATIWVAMPILKRTRPALVSPAPTGLESRGRPLRGRIRHPPTKDVPPTDRQDDDGESDPSPMSPTSAGPSLSGPVPAAPAPVPVNGMTSVPPGVDRRARLSRRLASADARVSRTTAISAGIDAPTPIAQDARLLAMALRSLRHDHDPRAALAALDAHAMRFPSSALGPEANVTRVDALLALDRRQAALAVLDRLDIPSTTRGRELMIVRAELRVGAKRYAEAIADFTGALAGDGIEDALSERALHGRIACYLATGNEDGARADLRGYLDRFPAGRFAPAVRRTLGEISGR
jgi:hypothetical protein